MYEEYVEEGKFISKIHVWNEIGWQGTKAIIEAMMTANYKHCESIRLWKGRCFDEGARQIALYLTKFHNCTVLELLDCGITALGCEFLMPAFTPKIGGNLTMIKLDHNPIGDEGCWILAGGLAKNPELVLLSLSYCDIGKTEKGPEGLFEILIYQNSKLQEFCLTGNPLGNAGIIKVFQGIAAAKTLSMIYLNDCAWNDE